LGGLARRASYIKSKTAQGVQALLIDGGDFIGGASPTDSVNTEFLLRGMAMLRYDAINLGERDFSFGLDFLLRLQKQHNLPFLSANIYRAGTDKLFAKPYIIKKIGGKRVGIFGITQAANLTSRIGRGEGALEVRDPKTTAEKMVQTLREKKCDVVIAVAHVGYQEAKVLAEQVPGIDIVLSAHGGYRTPGPAKVGNTVLLQPGSKGQYLGELKVVPAEQGGGVSHEGALVPLDSSLSDDPVMAGLVKSCNEHLEKLNQ